MKWNVWAYEKKINTIYFKSTIINNNILHIALIIYLQNTLYMDMAKLVVVDIDSQTITRVRSQK